jgi:hypothetical protein
MTSRMTFWSMAVCAVTLCFAAPVMAQLSSSGPQYNGTGITVNSNNQEVDRAGSPLFFGGPSTSNAVFVGGTPILRVRFSADGYTPEERASQIQQRLNLFLGDGPISADEITTQTEGDDAVVLVKGQLLFTADAATAHYNTTSPLSLADTWADSLRSVLPELTESK